MNNLWIFGDSFSAPFKNLTLWNWFKKYLAFLNTDRFNTWQEILAKNLNLKLVELGEAGISNSEIFDRFAANCNRFKDEDTVIINWTLTERFRVPAERDNKFVNLIPAHLKKTDYENCYFSFDDIQKIAVSRMHMLYQIEINNWANLINEFCKLKNIKVVFWGLTATQPYYDFDIPEQERVELKLRILDHQVGHEDHHFSVYGHEYVANRITSILENYKKKSTDLFIERDSPRKN